MDPLKCKSCEGKLHLNFNGYCPMCVCPGCYKPSNCKDWSKRYCSEECKEKIYEKLRKYPY